jgi:hypothetical protein
MAGVKNLVVLITGPGSADSTDFSTAIFQKAAGVKVAITSTTERKFQRLVLNLG